MGKADSNHPLADLDPTLGRLRPVERRHPSWWVEDIVVILAVLTLWPRILGWPGMFYRVLEVIALGVLVVIFVRRIGRFRRRGEEVGTSGR